MARPKTARYSPSQLIGTIGMTGMLPLMKSLGKTEKAQKRRWKKSSLHFIFI
jgi:hypothetical protein